MIAHGGRTCLSSDAAQNLLGTASKVFGTRNLGQEQKLGLDEAGLGKNELLRWTDTELSGGTRGRRCLVSGRLLHSH